MPNPPGPARPKEIKQMKKIVAYDDAVDLLDADHKAVKQMFID